MKKIVKQLSWVLAILLIVTSLNLNCLTAYAEGSVTIDENTKDKEIEANTLVNFQLTNGSSAVKICYYDSADYDTIIAENEHYDSFTLGPNEYEIKPTAWCVSYDRTVDVFDGCSTHYTDIYKAYYVTRFDNDTTVDSKYTLPEGDNIEGDKLNISIYAGNTLLKDNITVADTYTLCSYDELRNVIGAEEFDSLISEANYHKPTLTKLYYDIEYKGKEVSSGSTENIYNIKITLKPTIEVTFDANGGVLDSNVSGYAIPKFEINPNALPEASYEGVDFYGWMDRNNGMNFIYIQDKYNNNNYICNYISAVTPAAIVAMYIEKTPDFRLDLANKTIYNLLPNREYVYPLYNWDTDSDTVITTDGEGKIDYSGLRYFDSFCEIKLKRISANTLDSIYTSLRHPTPSSNINTKVTSTTITVTNPEVFAGCEYSLYCYDTGKRIDFQQSYVFRDLTPEYSYQLIIRHPADEYGFESYDSYTNIETPAVKSVSNEEPNGVAISDIPDQLFTGNPVQPELIIKDGEKVLVKDTDYKVEYTNNVAVTTASAIATVTFMDSYDGTMTKSFSILAKAEAPVISPMSGNFINTQSISVTSGTQDAAIYYTTDGSDPTKESTLYTGPFSINSSTTVKAIAVKTGMFDSDITSAVFTKTYISVSNEQPNGVAISDIPDQIFTGSPVQPELTIKHGDKVLVKNTDYTVEYSNNTTVTNNAFATVTFMGNYNGTMTKSFSIINRYSPVIVNPPKEDNNSGQTDNNNNNESTDNKENMISIAIGQKSINVFGEIKNSDVEPMIINNRTIVPARFIAESLGATVIWDKASPDDVIIELSDIRIKLHIGDIYAEVNEKKIKLDCAPFIKNDRTCVPLRFIAESLGFEVNWNEETKEITIIQKN